MLFSSSGIQKVRMRFVGGLPAKASASRTDDGKLQYGLSLCMDLYLFSGRRQSYADVCYLIYAFSTYGLVASLSMAPYSTVKETTSPT